MSKRFWGITCTFLILSVSIISWKAEISRTGHNSKLHRNAGAKNGRAAAKELFTQYVYDIYSTAQLSNTGLDPLVFQKAVTGFFNLKATNKIPQYSSVITIVDLAKSSCTRRLWIVDLINKELLLNTLVAHGNGSGDDVPGYFSNANDSHASSIGFYITDAVYHGKHGRSLKLDGLDAGYNDNARARSIVVHGAKYVSEGTISALGRLGRSEGCPAVSVKVVDKVINTMKGKNILFINGNDISYSSQYLNEDVAVNYVYPASSYSLNASL